MTCNNRNVVVTMTAVALMITLLVFASGVTTISKPTDTGTADFGKAGYVYSVEYQCGTQTTANDPAVQPGEYSTNVLIHNPFTFSVTVFTKKLQEKPSASSAWINGTSFTSGHTIGGDGALAIDCNDLKASGGNLATTFFKGVLVISHEIAEPSPTEGVLINQPLFGDESLDVTAAYTVSTASTGAAAVKHFNKVVVKKKELASDGTVTSTITELLIPAATGTITSTTEFDLKDAIDDKLSCSTNASGKISTICEVISINYAISAGGGGGGGANKHIETIKGKLVPFIPRPQS